MTDQQRFENKAREAARTLEQGALDLGTAATLANDLGDAFACAGLHMLRESLFRQIELIEEEISAVDARLAEGVGQGLFEIVLGVLETGGTVDVMTDDEKARLIVDRILSRVPGLSQTDPPEAQ